MLPIFVRLFRRAPKHSRLPQNDAESLDDETLLPSSSTTSSSRKATSPHVKSEFQVALKTFLVCSVVYLSTGIWIAHSVRKAEFVTNADQFCINFVSQYCNASPRRGLTTTNDMQHRWSETWNHDGIQSVSTGLSCTRMCIDSRPDRM